MGLRSVVQEVQSVFAFLSSVWSAFPIMVKLLILFAFGMVILLSVFRSFWG